MINYLCTPTNSPMFDDIILSYSILHLKGHIFGLISTSVLHYREHNANEVSSRGTLSLLGWVFPMLILKT